MPKDSSQPPSTIVSEQILRKKVRQIVNEHDDDNPVSMKAVREKLEEDLGVSLSSQKDALKKILQEEVNRAEEEEEEKKRTHSEVASSTSSDEPVTKKSKQESSAPKYVKADNGDYVIMFTGKKRITVNTYRRQKYVHIREYYEDKPTKKGIAMSQDEWDKFKEYIDTIDEMMRLN